MFFGVSNTNTSSHSPTLAEPAVLDASPGHLRTPGSFLFDILPGETLINNASGWGGMALDLSASPACAPSPTRNVTQSPLSITSLGRFLSRGNVNTHLMDILRASDGSSVLPNGPVSVTLADCSSDLLGFCYSPPFSLPVTLPVGDVYYIVAEEVANGDTLRVMTNPARGTIHAGGKRDGTTSMTYQGPGVGCIAGRVWRPSSSATWTITPDLDTAFGPVNFLVQGA